ncbi:MAG: hypothetical protein ACRDVE_00980 [Actinocrinis sp.]
MTDGYQVDPAVLEGGGRITHDLAERADALACELSTVFAELSSAAGATQLSSALADAGTVASHRMAQIVTVFAQMGASLHKTAQNYRQADAGGAERITGVGEGL